jgi:hypothetical protein
MSRSFAHTLLSLVACAALGSVATGQTEASTQAIFKHAAQQHAAGLKADLAQCSADLRSGLGDVVASLQDGSMEPDELPEGLATEFGEAFEAARGAVLGHAVDLDAVGSFLNAELFAADPDVGTPRGLVIGAGGALDDYHRKVQSALTILDRSFARELRRALQKVRKILPDSTVVTGHVFPLPLVQLADPGLIEDASESSFFPCSPLFLAGYGDENERNFAVLGMSTGGNDIDMNIYDADGDHLGTLDTTPLHGGQIYLGSSPVPAGDPGAQEPHGNLRIEMFANGVGWTAGIGY